MSKQQGFVGKAANATFHAVAIRNIIKAFMQGGWASAALQALKYYWPQILAITLVLILLPVIIVCCLPMMMFGFVGSTDSKITEMTSQAELVEGYFDNYDQYCQDRTDEINTEIEGYRQAGYTVVQVGYYMPKNWFISLFSVSIDNNLTGVTEQQIKDYLDNCIIYEITTPDADSDESQTEENTVTVKRLTVDEAMEYMEFSDSDKNWVKLIFNTLESEERNGNNSTYSN